MSALGQYQPLTKDRILSFERLLSGAKQTLAWVGGRTLER